MAQISNVIAFDGASTPVSHTFTPIQISRQGNKIAALWRETGLAVSMEAQPTLMIQLEQYPSKTFRVERQLQVPVMESVNGANAQGYTAQPKIAHVLKDTRVGYFSVRSDGAGRRLVRQLGTNIDNGVSFTVAPVLTGPVAELYDLLAVPT
jgi:hypothetical protein